MRYVYCYTAYALYTAYIVSTARTFYTAQTLFEHLWSQKANMLICTYIASEQNGVDGLEGWIVSLGCHLHYCDY